MVIEDVNCNKTRKAYIDFIYKVYSKDFKYKDTLKIITKNFLYNKDSFARKSYIRPILVLNEGIIRAVCMFIYNEHFPALQIAFFEALPNNQGAVNLIIDEAKNICRVMKLNRIVIGLNGHISYGVGMLMDNCGKDIAFDSMYNPPYYIDYFKHYGCSEVLLNSYLWDMKKQNFDKRILGRIYKKFFFRQLNLKKYKEEILLFSRIKNECLKDINLYFDKSPQEDYELMKNLKYFLKKENIIFAMKDNKEIGFVFWHPDYNQLVPDGKRSSPASMFLRNNFIKKRIKRFIINTIGVLPNYHGLGVTIGLFHEVYKYAKDKYSYGESSFVLQENVQSRRICVRFTDGESKHYVVFELSL